MDRKHITILGSCTTRNLFNNIVMQRIFDIDLYMFQICPFALFDQGLNIKSEIISKANIPEFAARNIIYELNKNTPNIIKEKKSEYFIVDFHTIYVNILLASIDDFKNSVITQGNHGWDIRHSLPKLQEVNELKNLKVKEIKFKDLDKSLIEKGIKKLADFLIENYEEEKVIIHIPVRTEFYADIDNNVFRFPPDQIENNKKNDDVVCLYSRMLAGFMPKAKVFYNSDNKIAKLIYPDIQEAKPIPESNHFSDYDNLLSSMALLKLLNIDYKQYCNQPPEQYESIRLNNVLMRMFKQREDLYSGVITLNQYFDRIENLNDVIVVISARDECSSKIKYFRNRRSINLKFNVNYRDSYIAIVDKCRNFILEMSKAEALQYTYTIDDKSIYVASAGFTSGNFSTIFTNNNMHNLSLQKRGLNIVILNSKTFEVVDVAYVDSYSDENLVVKSQYFKNIKLKV